MTFDSQEIPAILHKDTSVISKVSQMKVQKHKVLQPQSKTKVKCQLHRPFDVPFVLTPIEGNRAITAHGVFDIDNEGCCYVVFINKTKNHLTMTKDAVIGSCEEIEEIYEVDKDQEVTD